MARDKAQISGVVASLLTFIVVVIGMVSTSSKERLAEYHNSFMTLAYRAVILEGWNPLVELIQKGNGSSGPVLSHLDGILIPALDTWSKKAVEAKPPKSAEDFHSRFSNELASLAVDAKKFEEVLQKEDQLQIEKFLLQLNSHVKLIQDDAIAFQAMLQKDFHITIEPKK